MNSKQLICSYKVIHYWWHGLYNSMWRELNRMPGNQTEIRRQIATKCYEINELLKQAYEVEVGKQVLYEVRIGK